MAYNISMLNRRALAGLVALLSPVFLPALAAGADSSHAQCSILADAAAISAGKPFTLGILIKIDPGWHIYWKNPGDSGLPTQVSFNLPPGFTAGPLQFPTPTKFPQPGNLAIFGYEDSVLLSATVTPPSQLPANFSAPFSAAISWLACQDECVRGKQTVSLTLPSADAPAASTDKPLFESWAAQLPISATNSPDISSVATNGEMSPAGNHSSGDFSMDITWKNPAPDAIDFFPGPADDYNITSVKTSSTGHLTHITFTVDTLAGIKPSPTTLEIVLGYSKLPISNDSNKRGVSVLVPLPRANMASASN